MSVADDLLTNPYLLRDVLQVYRGILKEQKERHEINCPECEEQKKPCRRYYWLFLDIQEINWKIQLLSNELKQPYVE